MEILMFFLVLMAFTGHSSATYCICKDGVGDSALQKVIDYACGAGADCSGILAKGSCYNPNTLKDHCNYAANSYFQKKGQATGTCDFAGSANPSTSIPAQASGCVYQSSPSSTTPSTTPPSTTTSPPGSITPPSAFNFGPAASYNSDFANGIIVRNVNLIVPLALATSILWFWGFSLLQS